MTKTVLSPPTFPLLPFLLLERFVPQTGTFAYRSVVLTRGIAHEHTDRALTVPVGAGSMSLLATIELCRLRLDHCLPDSYTRKRDSEGRHYVDLQVARWHRQDIPEARDSEVGRGILLHVPAAMGYCAAGSTP